VAVAVAVAGLEGGHIDTDLSTSQALLVCTWKSSRHLKAILI